MWYLQTPKAGRLQHCFTARPGSPCQREFARGLVDSVAVHAVVKLLWSGMNAKAPALQRGGSRQMLKRHVLIKKWLLCAYMLRF